MQSTCIIGGGPAGMMLGLLLARSGLPVTVLEKHGDFFRDFRGDTTHPSTLQALHELGLLGGFLKLPHQRIEKINAVVGGRTFRSRTSPTCPPLPGSSPCCRNGTCSTS